MSRGDKSKQLVNGRVGSRGCCRVGGVKTWVQPSISLTLCWPLSCCIPARAGEMPSSWRQQGVLGGKHPSVPLLGGEGMWPGLLVRI